MASDLHVWIRRRLSLPGLGSELLWALGDEILSRIFRGGHVPRYDSTELGEDEILLTLA